MTTTNASPLKVARYKCPFCAFLRASKSKVLYDHIEHCLRNPDRRPWLGELSSITTEPWGEDDPPWWPGLGKIYTHYGWQDVEGYRDTSTEEEHSEKWPEQIDNWEPCYRLAWHYQRTDQMRRPRSGWTGPAQ